MVQPFRLNTHVEQVLDEFTDWPCCNDFVQRNRYAYTQIELKHRSFLWDFVGFTTFNFVKVNANDAQVYAL